MDKKKYLAFYGTGGCARSLLPITKEVKHKYSLIYVDDFKKNEFVNNIKVLNFPELLDLSKTNHVEVVVAISDNKTRKEIVDKLNMSNLNIYNLISKKTYIMDNVKYEDGIVLSPFVTIGSNVNIGKHFHANLYSFVEHDCIIGDFVTFATGVKCNGNVIIEDNVFIGSGSIIINGSEKEKNNNW